MIRADFVHRRVRHAHTERADGAVGNGSVPGFLDARAALVRAVGGDPAALVVPHQTHGAVVRVVTRGDRGRTFPATDGLVTAEPDVPLLVQGADCPLVLLADDAAGIAAVVHSGWRGTVQRIVAVAVESMRSVGARPAAVDAAVFPGIGPCCFEVGPEVVGAFRGAFGPEAGAWTHPGDGDRSRLDLGASIRSTLEAAGVAAARIRAVPGCTVCGGRWFSHRGSRGAPERHGLVARVAVG